MDAGAPVPLSLEERAAWLPILEAMAASVASALGGVAGTERGRERLGIGAGGDNTSIVDRVAEDAVMEACARLAGAGMRFRLQSEEIGERDYGAPHPILLVDPVDGSLNAMAGLPYYCTALAVLDGDTLGDVAAGVVRNLATGETYSGVRGGGVTRSRGTAAPLSVALDERGRIPMVLLEAHRGFGHLDTGVARPLSALLTQAVRVRLLGSSALSLCQVATGAASVLVAPDGMRAYDCAAGLCILGESGAVVTDLDGVPVEAVPAEFGRRTSIVASMSPSVHAHAIELLRAPLGGGREPAGGSRPSARM